MMNLPAAMWTIAEADEMGALCGEDSLAEALGALVAVTDPLRWQPVNTETRPAAQATQTNHLNGFSMRSVMRDSRRFEIHICFRAWGSIRISLFEFRIS